MIKAKVKGSKTLQEFHDSIKDQYKEAHGEDYCKYYDDLQELMSECESYKELGVNQGAAVSAVLLGEHKPKRVHCVDLELTNFDECRDLFESYTKEHGIELIVQQCDSSSDDCASVTDMLFIDSSHHAGHTIVELMVHAPKTKKYIIAHDTSDNVRAGKQIHGVLMQHCENFPEWKLHKRCQLNQGYTIIKRD